MDKLAKELKTMMTASDDRKPKPYDTQAEVLRVEDGVAWVHIPGGVQETPVRLTMNAKKGDMVNVRVANGSAWITGNGTNPPTDDTTANIANETASKAMSIGEMAMSDAARAYEAANRAESEADRAGRAADDAERNASDALTNANLAQTAADIADRHAISAQQSATSALQSLSVVENVVDVVQWFANHRTLSADTTVNETKNYYIYNQLTGTLVLATPDGTENPSALGWYELTEAVGNYVNTHLALTDRGLSVFADGMKGSMLLSANGVAIYPPGSDNPIASYGSDAVIGNTLGKHIRIDSSGLTMWAGDESNQANKVAWFSDNQLHIPNAVVTDNLITGRWKWDASTNADRLDLKYIGVQ